jgi:hypothetical protein
MALMTDLTAGDPAEVDEQQPELDAVDEQLIDGFAARARAGGLQLAGEGGLLQQLTKRLLESALEGKLTDHLGYDRHDPAGQNSGNSRNRSAGRIVVTRRRSARRHRRPSGHCWPGVCAGISAVARANALAVVAGVGAHGGPPWVPRPDHRQGTHLPTGRAGPRNTRAICRPEFPHRRMHSNRRPIRSL